MRGVPRERTRDLARPFRCHPRLQQARRALDDGGQFLMRIELEPGDDAEAIAQRIRQHAGARRGADQRERRQVELDRARSRTLADDDVDLEILQGRVEDLLDDRRQAMDLVDEEDVVLLEVGQDGGKVPRPLEDGPGGLPHVHAHLVRDDVRQRGLAQARRTEQQHVIQRLRAIARRRDEDPELLADLRLADVLGKRRRAQRALDGLLVW